MTEFKGSDGTITRDGDDVVLTFSGFTCTPAKKAVSPRRVPLAAVAEVTVVQPKGMKPGLLRLVRAGAPDSGLKPNVDPDVLTFNKGKAEAAAEAFAEELRAVIGGDAAVAAEIAAPPGDPAKKPGFVARQQALADQHQQDLRASGVLFQGTSHDPGRNATVTLYGDRLERVKEAKMTSLSRAKQDVEVTPTRSITSVQAKKDGLLYTKVTAFASGNNIDFRFSHDEAERFRTALMAIVLGGPPVPAAAPAAAAAPVDVVEQLTKLAALRDQGILTDEEFAAQKAKLLA